MINKKSSNEYEVEVLKKEDLDKLVPWSFFDEEEDTRDQISVRVNEKGEENG